MRIVIGTKKELWYNKVMKDGFVKVATATPRIRVANTEFNARSIIDLMNRAEEKGVKVLVFPELSITGYTSGDLFFQEKLLNGAKRALSDIQKASKDKDMLIFVGYPHRYCSKLYNTAVVLNRGRIIAVCAKKNIPNYGEFYEKRWFQSAPEENTTTQILGSDVPFGYKFIFTCKNMDNLRVAVEICEDLWVPNPPSVSHALAGATVIVNPSASDELVGKREYRKNLVISQSARLVSGYVYADTSFDESTSDMVFAGANLIAENGALLESSLYAHDSLMISELDVDKLSSERARMDTFPSICQGYSYIDFELLSSNTVLSRSFSPFPFVPNDDLERERRLEEILTLQALGLRKRIEHTNAKGSVIGLSGGLDSTLALLVCVKAYDMLSRDRKEIIGVTMPCFGTTKRTRSNAELLAKALKITFKQIDIKNSVERHLEDISHPVDLHDVTYENAQARERTQVLMDIANSTGSLVIGTGDLSELALGWATYNGDHMSMYGVNCGVPKTLVKHLVAYYAKNASEDVASVLLDVLATPVSPELLPAKNGKISQITEDIVGPYELHDFFLYYMVRQGFSPRKIFRLADKAFSSKYDRITIKKWLVTFVSRFFSQQFKRNCLPDGPKVGTLTLSPRSDWRMPSDADSSLWIEEAMNLEV